MSVSIANSKFFFPIKAPYVKVYMMKNRKCIAKAKTAPARRTLDPLYQQQLTFREDYRQCILQVSFKIDLYLFKELFKGKILTADF